MLSILAPWHKLYFLHIFSFLFLHTKTHWRQFHLTNSHLVHYKQKILIAIFRHNIHLLGFVCLWFSFHNRYNCLNQWANSFTLSKVTNKKASFNFFHIRSEEHVKGLAPSMFSYPLGLFSVSELQVNHQSSCKPVLCECKGHRHPLCQLSTFTLYKSFTFTSSLLMFVHLFFICHI